MVRACIEAGAHQLDLSGKPQYIETMQLKCDEHAKEHGVYVVSACGFDFIAADMSIIFVDENCDGVVNSVETFVVYGIEDM